MLLKAGRAQSLGTYTLELEHPKSVLPFKAVDFSSVPGGFTDAPCME